MYMTFLLLVKKSANDAQLTAFLSPPQPASSVDWDCAGERAASGGVKIVKIGRFENRCRRE
jgi:hypothetical protein